MLVWSILVWMLIWAVSWIVFNHIALRKIDYINGYRKTAAYFAGISALVIVIFKDDFETLVPEELSIIPFLLLLSVFLVNFIIYHNSGKFGFLKKEYRKDLFFLSMDKRYLVSKSFEIFFQQLMISLLIIWMSDEGFSTFRIIFIFLILFGMSHAFLIFSKGKFYGCFFLFAALISSVIFPFVLVNFEYGFVYNYIIHILFYVSSAVFLRFFFDTTVKN